jgi:hypothetical protein
LIEGGEGWRACQNTAMAEPPGAHQPGAAILGRAQGVAMGSEAVFLIVHDEGGAAAPGEPAKGVNRAERVLVFVFYLLDHRIEQPDGRRVD